MADNIFQSSQLLQQLPPPGAWQGNWGSTLPPLTAPSAPPPYTPTGGSTPNWSNMGPLNFPTFTSPVAEDDATGEMRKQLEAQWMSAMVPYQQLLNNWNQWNMQFGAAENQRGIDNSQSQLNDYNQTALAQAQQRLAENNSSAAYNQWANQFAEQQRLNAQQGDQWQQRFGFDQSQADTAAGQWQQNFGLNQQRFGLEQSQADTQAAQWQQNFGLNQQRFGLEESEAQRQGQQWQQRFGFDQSEAQRAQEQWQQQFGFNQAEADRAGSQWQQRFGFDQSEAERAGRQWQQQFGFTQSEADRAAQQWQQQFGYTEKIDKARLQQGERFRKYDAFGRAATPRRSSFSGSFR